MVGNFGLLKLYLVFLVSLMAATGSSGAAAAAGAEERKREEGTGKDGESVRRFEGLRLQDDEWCR